MAIASLRPFSTSVLTCSPHPASFLRRPLPKLSATFSGTFQACSQHQHRRAQLHRCCGVSNSMGDTPQLPEAADHRKFLFKYVTEVEPTVVDSFRRSAPADVVEAMRSTTHSLLSGLPSQFFEVTISTLGDNLRSLMFSFLMTGYLFRNIEYQLELQRGMQHSLPASVLETDVEDDRRAGMKVGLRSTSQSGYADGVNKQGVTGDVTRWRHHLGSETVPALEYIEALETEVARLKSQIAAKAKEVEDEGDEENPVLKYLRTSPHYRTDNLKASAEVTEAMEMFLTRLLGTDNAEELASYRTEQSAGELGRCLSWLMVVGYTLRSMEVRFSMEQSYSLPHVSLEDQIPFNL